VPLNQTFTYTSPRPLSKGQIVKVPFGPRTLWGIVWQTDVSFYKGAKPVIRIHPSLLLDQSFLRFLEKMAQYTLTPLGALIKMVLPEPEILEWPWGHYILKSDKNVSSEPLPFPSWVECLGKRKAFTAFKKENLTHINSPIEVPPPLEKKSLILEDFQKRAFEQFLPQAITLLQGMTGSGKTEISLEFCKTIWQHNKQVLILLPEIALCQQWLARFETYFQGHVCVWHSGLSQAQRTLMFSRILHGQESLIIGARSALALPFLRLGLIIVDEEHDPSYKQNDPPLYHARDMAVLRASYAEIPCLLLSATPSLETLWNVQEKRYQHIEIQQRYQGAQLPDIHLIDLKKEPLIKGQWVTNPLRKVLEDTLEKGQQSLLFVNRRGYGSLLLCWKCNFRGSCPNCSVWLTVHHTPCEKLICHYCGFSAPLPKTCPDCGQDKPLMIMGAGVEKIQQEVTSFLPQARLEIFSTDTLENEDTLKASLNRVKNHEVDILIGTQLLAKGHHFPLLSCIGIIEADFALSQLDIRAAERLYQVLWQVTGRAGRELIKGQAFLQTALASHPLFQSLKNHQISAFIQEEMQQRKLHHFPPYGRLASIILSGRPQEAVHAFALQLQRHLPSLPQGVEVLGPAPAPLNPLRRRFRWRFLITSPRYYPIQEWISKWIETIKKPSNIQCSIDIDPYFFF